MNRMTYNKRLYKQAMEILHLSRHISEYLLFDYAALQPNGNEHPDVYFTGDIVRHSDSLAPQIIKAANHPFQDDRIKHAHDLNSLTQRLHATCERLERAESNGKDFIKHLRHELHKFSKLQRKWMMTL
ncbi:MAG: hypothetical protein WBG71_12060 [Leeuwenhoekiella sp.]